MTTKRFTGDTYRCPNAPYMIRDKKETVLRFKHDELPNGFTTLNKICDLLNCLDDEIVLLKKDLTESDNYNEDFEYNITRLENIRKDYNEKLKLIRREKFNLRYDYNTLKEENEKLKTDLDGACKLADYYREQYNILRDKKDRVI